MENLINTINNFNTYYVMSDSSTVYNTAEELKTKIKNELAELSHTELVELNKSLKEAKATYFKVDALIEASTPSITEAPIKSELSKLMTCAWSMFKAGSFDTISEALKAAWKASKLRKALKNGIAYFTFRKADNTVRKAIGTLRNGNFEYTARSSGKKQNLATIKYFDVEKQAWRACRVDRLIA